MKLSGASPPAFITNLSINGGSGPTSLIIDLTVDVPNSANHVNYLPEKTYAARLVIIQKHAKKKVSSNFTIKIYN